MLLLVDEVVRGIGESHDPRALKKDKNFLKKVAELEANINRFTVIDKELTIIKTKNILFKKKATFFMVPMFFYYVFFILLILCGLIAKYITRPGFYRFNEEHKYLELFVNYYLIFALIVGVVAYIKYCKATNPKYRKFTIKEYKLTIEILRNRIKSLPENVF